MHGIIGFIIALALIAMHIAADKNHREKHGVGLPSKNARKRYRRRARDTGVSETAAHSDWVRNKHRWQGTTPPAAPVLPFTPTPQRTSEPSSQVDLAALEKATAPVPAEAATRSAGHKVGLVCLVVAFEAIVIIGALHIFDRSLFQPAEPKRQPAESNPQRPAESSLQLDRPILPLSQPVRPTPSTAIEPTAVAAPASAAVLPGGKSSAPVKVLPPPRPRSLDRTLRQRSESGRRD